MMATLGMPSSGSSASSDVQATPRPERSFNTNHGAASALPRPAGVSVEVASLRAALGDKEDELAALRREVAVLEREKGVLSTKCDKLEREKKDSGGTAGLDVRQLEELERQFEQQEKLLMGYQREAEKSAAEMDALKMRCVQLSLLLALELERSVDAFVKWNRQRRFIDYFDRVHGGDWETDLGLSDKPNTLSSPVARIGKLAARASLAPTGTPPPLNRLDTGSSSSSIFASTSPSLLEEPKSPSDAPSPPPAVNGLPPPPSSATIAAPASGAFPFTLVQDPAAAAALKQHLESVQVLLRSMEARLIARDGELVAVEKRAREEKEEAEGKTLELKEMVQRLTAVKV